MMRSTSSFMARLTQVAGDVETTLQALLSDRARGGEVARPARLMAAMRHAALGGGKRLRPFLTVETALMLDGDQGRALRAGCAVELLHCYSLVHDDLPSMDNDDLRRGRPTVHKAYDEATAILVGDALQSLAFEVLADPDSDPDPSIRASLVLGLANAAGLGGMVGGQMLDLAAEGRYGAVIADQPGIRLLQAMKTGALLAFSVEAGAVSARATPSQFKSLGIYGRALGAAFQIADDLLDREATEETMGKRTGKDREMGKATLVDLLGIDEARAECSRLVAEAEAALAPFGERGAILSEAVRYVAVREA